VTGWKRVLAYADLAYGENLSKVYEENELTDEDCIKIIYSDN
jgi:hypothetical protein